MSLSAPSSQPIPRISPPRSLFQRCMGCLSRRSVPTPPAAQPGQMAVSNALHSISPLRPESGRRLVPRPPEMPPQPNRKSSGGQAPPIPNPSFLVAKIPLSSRSASPVSVVSSDSEVLKRVPSTRVDVVSIFGERPMGFVFKTEQFRRPQSSVSRRALVPAEAPEMPDSDSKEWGVDDIQSVLRRTDPDSVQVLFSALSRGVVTPEKTVDDTETTVLTWASRELGRRHTDVSKKKLSLLVKYAKSSTDGFALNTDVSGVIARISGHPDDLVEGLTTMLKLLINDKDSATVSTMSEGGYFSRSQLDLYREVAFMILKGMDLPTEIVSSIRYCRHEIVI